MTVKTLSYLVLRQTYFTWNFVPKIKVSWKIKKFLFFTSTCHERLFVHVYGTNTKVTGSERTRICNAVSTSGSVKVERKWQEIKHWLGGLPNMTAAQTQAYYTTWKNSKNLIPIFSNLETVISLFFHSVSLNPKRFYRHSAKNLLILGFGTNLNWLFSLKLNQALLLSTAYLWVNHRLQ